MHAPQIIYLVLVFIGLMIAAREHGKPRVPSSFWITLIAALIVMSLLIWGGFFK